MKNLLVYLTLSLLLLTCCLGTAMSQDSLIPGKSNENSSIENGNDWILIIDWIKDIKDDQLLDLVKIMAKNNPDLKRMIAVIGRLKTEYGIAKSSLYPSLNLDITVGTGKDYDDSSRKGYRFSLPASYELDVWKKIRAKGESAFLEFEAVKEDRKSIMITLLSELMERYYTGLYLIKQLFIFDEIIYLIEQANDLQSKMHKEGLIAKKGLLENEQMLQEVLSMKLNLKKELSVAERSLKVLTGDYPKDQWLKGDFYMPKCVWEIPINLSSNILMQRPDLRALKLRLDSSEWKITSAKSDLFPTIKLVGKGEKGSSSLNQLTNGSSSFWELFLQISIPIFEGNKKKLEYQSQQFEYDELMQKYKNTLINAFSEVENALGLSGEQKKIVENLKERQKLLSEETDIVNKRYEEGLDELLSLILIKQKLLFYEMEHHKSEIQFVSFRIELIRSLGGVWWAKENNNAYLEETIDLLENTYFPEKIGEK